VPQKKKKIKKRKKKEKLVKTACKTAGIRVPKKVSISCFSGPLPIIRLLFLLEGWLYQT
jgi:hypothetical protein